MSWIVGLLIGYAAAFGPQEPTARETFDAIARNLPERPIPRVLSDGSNGRLELGWNRRVIPILASDAGVFVAASHLGQGRIVAFSGQGFFGSDDASSFLGLSGNDALIRNAAHWASGRAESFRVLVDNEEAAQALRSSGIGSVRVARIARREGLHEFRDWSRSALSEVDVAVVLVNEWDSTHVASEDIVALREFVTEGGGLLIGGSSFHWDGEDPVDFPANRIAAGSGIAWSDEEQPDLARARIEFGPLSNPIALWKAYVDGQELNVRELARLPSLLISAEESGRHDEVARAIARVWRETPELPVGADDARARLSAKVALTQGAREWPSPHPWAATFPGEPAPSAERVEREVVVDGRWIGARPLGLYAAPGERVVLRFAEEHVGRGWVVAIGDGHDDLRDYEFSDWQRAPRLETGFAVDTSVVAVSNPFGGPIYLVLPADEELGSISIGSNGAVPMAVFTLGESDSARFRRELDLGAPQAIFQARGRMRFVVPTAAARRVEDPVRMLEFWSAYHASHSELAQEPTPRRFESHWIFGPQVGWGYANATAAAASIGGPHHWFDRVVFPLDAVDSILTMEDVDAYWTVGHELGHQFQTDDWIGGDLTEVAVNLFPLYTTNGFVNGGGEHETAGFEEDFYRHEDLVDFRWDDVGEWEKLQLYRQLILEFGWTPMKRTFASYYDPAFPRDEFGGHLDGFAIRFSAIVERDLTAFLTHWEYPLSTEAVAKIRSFGFEPWWPPGWPAPAPQER